MFSVPHLIRLLQQANRLNFASDSVPQTFASGDPAAALAYFQTAYDTRCKLLGEEDPLTQEAKEWMDDCQADIDNPITGSESDGHLTHDAQPSETGHEDANAEADDGVDSAALSAAAAFGRGGDNAHRGSISMTQAEEHADTVAELASSLPVSSSSGVVLAPHPPAASRPAASQPPSVSRRRSLKLESYDFKGAAHRKSLSRELVLPVKLLPDQEEQQPVVDVPAVPEKSSAGDAQALEREVGTASEQQAEQSAPSEIQHVQEVDSLQQADQPDLPIEEALPTAKLESQRAEIEVVATNTPDDQLSNQDEPLPESMQTTEATAV